MMIWCRKVVCGWEPKHFVEYRKRLARKGILHEYRKVTVLAGPEKALGRQRKQKTRKCGGFGTDPHEYKIIKPL